MNETVDVSKDLVEELSFVIYKSSIYNTKKNRLL